MDLKTRIESSWAGPDIDTDAVERVLAALDRGELRVAEPVDGQWVVHSWIKQAILLYFRIAQMRTGHYGDYEYHDKIPLKTGLAEQGVRVVPPGTVRYGAFLERGCVVMPGYVNLGAWVGAGTMVDTWATVGSCAQIGRGVHLSGGVGIGGVLEPPAARPVIIEDGAFVGSRCIVVEGVIVHEEAVIGAGTTLTASTPIIDVTGPTEVVHKGSVPARAVVVPGTRTKRFPAGDYQLPCALIIGHRTESTDRKTSLNHVLREFALAVCPGAAPPLQAGGAGAADLDVGRAREQRAAGLVGAKLHAVEALHGTAVGADEVGVAVIGRLRDRQLEAPDVISDVEATEQPRRCQVVEVAEQRGAIPASVAQGIDDLGVGSGSTQGLEEREHREPGPGHTKTGLAEARWPVGRGDLRGAHVEGLSRLRRIAPPPDARVQGIITSLAVVPRPKCLAGSRCYTEGSIRVVLHATFALGP